MGANTGPRYKCRKCGGEQPREELLAHSKNRPCPRQGCDGVCWPYTERGEFYTGHVKAEEAGLPPGAVPCGDGRYELQMCFQCEEPGTYHEGLSDYIRLCDKHAAAIKTAAGFAGNMSQALYLLDELEAKLRAMQDRLRRVGGMEPEFLEEAAATFGKVAEGALFKTLAVCPVSLCTFYLLLFNYKKTKHY